MERASSWKLGFWQDRKNCGAILKRFSKNPAHFIWWDPPQLDFDKNLQKWCLVSLDYICRVLRKSWLQFDLCLYPKVDQKVNLWKKSTLTKMVVSGCKRCRILCWSFFINKPCVCDLPFDLCLYPELWAEVTILQGIDTGQTGGHRPMGFYEKWSA